MNDEVVAASDRQVDGHESLFVLGAKLNRIIARTSIRRSLSIIGAGSASNCIVLEKCLDDLQVSDQTCKVQGRIAHEILRVDIILKDRFAIQDEVDFPRENCIMH